ncbi:MAG: VWA domain-containing protein [Inquilinaceae bacterium]
MADPKGRVPAAGGSRSAVDAFLHRLAAAPVPRPAGSRGRLIFAMDATASREPTWDRACHIQAEMFAATADLGGLDVQLVFYRGFRECKTSPWLSDAAALARRMTAVRCMAGHTQLGRVLNHAAVQTRKQKVNALVFVGDCFEEDPDAVGHAAGELGMLGVPVFLFQEGQDPAARRMFQQIARLTGGAYCPFDLASAQQLKDLLGAVAVYAAGGRAALEDYGRSRGGAAQQLTHQFDKK